MAYTQKDIKDYIYEVAVEMTSSLGTKPSIIWNSKSFQQQLTTIVTKQIATLEQERQSYKKTSTTY